jgi:hypothetical protein
VSDTTARVYGTRTWATDPASGATVVRLDDERAAVTGSPVQVGQLLDRLGRTGRLARVSDPQPTGQAGQVLVTVRLLQPRPAPALTPRTGPRSRVLPWVWWTAGGAAAAVLAGLAWLVVAAVAWVAAHWAHLLVGLVVLAAVLGGLGRAGVCVGMHCPGCRHR